jgi:hypothetical protein
MIEIKVLWNCRKQFLGPAWWHMPIIPVTQEAEERGSQLRAGPSKSARPKPKNIY